MPSACAEDEHRINEEHDEELNGPKPRKPTSMEHLQARRVMAHDKRDWKELKQAEKSISWKQSVRSASRKRKNARKRRLSAHIARQQKVPWRKPDPPSGDDSHAGGSNASCSIAQ